MLRASNLCRMLLLSSTLFFSCITVDHTLGDNLIPSDQDLSLNMATFDLPIDSRLTDSLSSNNFFFSYDDNIPFLFGACFDPLFGLTETGSVFQFFPATAFSYGENPEPTSLTLYVFKQNSIVLDETQASIPQNVFVHKTLTPLTHKNAYNNSFGPEDWNSAPISQPGQVYFGSDTLAISLSLDYARELLTATQEEKDSIHLFVQRFKGLYLRTETMDARNHAGRINLAGNISMTLKYKLDGADSTLSYFCGSYVKTINTITHSRSSIAQLSLDNVYYQGFAGFKPYINMVSLTQAIRTWAEQSQIDIKKILLSRAEIVLSYDPTIDYTMINQYPSVLYPFTRRHTDSTSFYLPIDNVYASNADGIINRSNYQYSMIITSFLQSLLKKEAITEQDNVWLMETIEYYDDNTGYRTFLYNTYSYPLATFKGVTSNAKPYLKITYSILK